MEGEKKMNVHPDLAPTTDHEGGGRCVGGGGGHGDKGASRLHGQSWNQSKLKFTTSL